MARGCVIATTLRHFISRLEGLDSKPTLVIQDYGRDRVFSFTGIYKSFARSKSLSVRLTCSEFGCSCHTSKFPGCVLRQECYKNADISSSRGKIKSFSSKSRRRCRLALRNIIQHLPIELTLTYPREFPFDGAICNRHYRALRARLARRGVKVFWIKEFQERGAPHLHLLASRYVNREWLAQAWYEIVGSGDLKHLVAGTRVDWVRSPKRTASYYSEYMSKLHQKQVPSFFQNVGRFWGFTKSLLTVRTYALSSDYFTLSRLTRQARRFYRAKCRDWGFDWKWKGKGFVFWDWGAPDESFSFDTMMGAFNPA